MTPEHSDTRSFPHEAAFLLLWFGQIVALLIARVARPLDLLLVVMASTMICLMNKGHEGPWRTARLWFPFIAFNLTYMWIGDAIPRLGTWRADEALLDLDRMAFGECLSLKLAPWISSTGHDLLSFSYLLFFPLWILAFVVASRRGGKFRTGFFSGFYLVYAIGFAGYSIFPAGGPFHHPPLKDALGQLAAGGWISRLNDSIVLRGCNGVDVFPSLHTAITLFVLLSAFTLSRRLFAVLLIPCCLIVAATIGLQYHYAADLVAGAVLGAGAWCWNVRLTLKNQTSPLSS